MPYQASDGWSCTRKCLVEIMGQYLAALAKNDSSGIPFADDIVLVENTQKTPIGEGLWKTATGGPNEFKIIVGEPKVIKITGVPGITERPNDYGVFDLPAVHIFKIRDGKIHEIEAIGYMAEHGITNGWE
jgi:hypothetical protein